MDNIIKMDLFNILEKHTAITYKNEIGKIKEPTKYIQASLYQKIFKDTYDEMVKELLSF